MKRERTRVVIPHKINDVNRLVNSIHEKHTADGADSPLKLIEEQADATTFKSRIETIMQLHHEAEHFRNQMEIKFSERDKILKPLMKEVRVSAQFLKSLHSSNNFAMCFWGFEVNHSRPAKKKKTEE